MPAAQGSPARLGGQAKGCHAKTDALAAVDDLIVGQQAQNIFGVTVSSMDELSAH